MNSMWFINYIPCIDKAIFFTSPGIFDLILFRFVTLIDVYNSIIIHPKASTQDPELSALKEQHNGSLSI